MKTSEIKKRGWVFVSGPDTGAGICCYNCGEQFRHGIKKTSEAGDFIICQECGGRGAYLVSEDDPEITS